MMFGVARPAANPDAYVATLTGWQLVTTRKLRNAVLAADKSLVESIKWGNLFYFSGGPLLVIRAEAHRVLFAFWRGQRLRDIDDRLKPGGKFEMATIELREKDTLSTAVALRLTRQAIKLNKTLGDPTKPPAPKRAKAVRRTARTVRHKDGSLWAKGYMKGAVMDGPWKWFRKDGVIMRSGAFEDGTQVGDWVTYDRKGKVYKVTRMKPGTKGK